MTRVLEVECDWCHAKLEDAGDETEEEFFARYFGEGWIEVKDTAHEGEIKDFCCKPCLVAKYEGEE